MNHEISPSPAPGLRLPAEADEPNPGS